MILGLATLLLGAVQADKPPEPADEFEFILDISEAFAVWEREPGQIKLYPKRAFIYPDTIFDVIEDGQRARHVVVHMEHEGGFSRTLSYLVYCDKTSARPIWQTTDEVLVFRPNLELREEPSPQGSPMWAVIKATCEHSL